MNITATQLKQRIQLLSNVTDEDIIVTKREKPFAVIMDFNRYQELLDVVKDIKKQNKLNALNSLKSFELGGNDYKNIKSQMA